ncbi:MAG TPA: flagellar hook-basal body complex protein FliE [Tepidisphaeraceae bacterium]|nr:flagellar hook-basal body complex protein FliE [Tepidisphaeraceae bacterium]
MINGIPTTGVTPPTTSTAISTAPTAGGASFSDMLKNSIDEVAKLQQDASQATQDLLTGRTEDVTGVFTAMEKSDVAFKTLLAIRGKLMDAFDEIKNMPI